MITNLTAIYAECANAILQAYPSMIIDSEECRQTIMAQFNEGSQKHEFFIVLGVQCAMADVRARQQGFENQAHMAITKALVKFPPLVNPFHVTNW